MLQRLLVAPNASRLVSFHFVRSMASNTQSALHDVFAPRWHWTLLQAPPRWYESFAVIPFHDVSLTRCVA